MKEQVVPLPLVAVTPIIGQGQCSKKNLVTDVSFASRSGGTLGLRKTRSKAEKSFSRISAGVKTRKISHSSSFL